MRAAQATKVRAAYTARILIWLQGLGGLVGFALLLEIVPRIGIISPDYLPPFSQRPSGRSFEFYGRVGH